MVKQVKERALHLQLLKFSSSISVSKEFYLIIQVFFKCGNEDKIINIVEPVLCQYNLTFETPLACAQDAFLGEYYRNCKLTSLNDSMLCVYIFCAKFSSPAGVITLLLHSV